MQELGLVEIINYNQEVAKWIRSWSVMQLVPVEKIDNAISSNTPNDEGEDDEYRTILTKASWMMKTGRGLEG